MMSQSLNMKIFSVYCYEDCNIISSNILSWKEKVTSDFYFKIFFSFGKFILKGRLHLSTFLSNIRRYSWKLYQYLIRTHSPCSDFFCNSKMALWKEIHIKSCFPYFLHIVNYMVFLYHQDLKKLFEAFLYIIIFSFRKNY